MTGNSSSPTSSMVYNTRSRRPHIEEGPRSSAPVEESVEEEPVTTPNFSHVVFQLNTDNDLDLVSKRERDIYKMIANRSYAPTRVYEPDFLAKTGMDSKFGTIFHTVRWNDIVPVDEPSSCLLTI